MIHSVKESVSKNRHESEVLSWRLDQGKVTRCGENHEGYVIGK